MRYDVFISYSSRDQKIAEGVCAYLEQHGIRCFVAYRDIPRGVVWAGAIVDALEHSRMMLVLFSKHFNDSQQVDREIELAAEQGMPILTFRLSEDDFTGAKKYYLKNLNWIDAFPNPEHYFGSLKDNVCRLLGQESTPISVDKVAKQEQQPEQPQMEQHSPAVLTGKELPHTSSNPNRKWGFAIAIGLVAVVTAIAIGLQWNNARRMEEERKALVAQMRNDSIARAEQIRKDSMALAREAELHEQRERYIKDSLSIVMTAKQSLSTSFSVTGKLNGREYVDLGLSVKWAICNVGASSPIESGDFYAWGEVRKKGVYDWSTYKWGSKKKTTKYFSSSSKTKEKLDLQDDVARVKWGGSWRMPTLEEFEELKTHCSWTWTSVNGISGYMITGTNRNSIFLPALNIRDGFSRDGAGFYWSATYPYPPLAYELFICKGHRGCSFTYRCDGGIVRPVTE